MCSDDTRILLNFREIMCRESVSKSDHISLTNLIIYTRNVAPWINYSCLPYMLTNNRRIGVYHAWASNECIVTGVYIAQHTLFTPLIWSQYGYRISVGYVLHVVLLICTMLNFEIITSNSQCVMVIVMLIWSLRDIVWDDSHFQCLAKKKKPCKNIANYCAWDK